MIKTRSVILEFDPLLNNLPEHKELRDGLSVVIQIGNTLWVTNDETLTLERLSLEGGDSEGNYKYGSHRQFALGDYLKLSIPPQSSAEIEEADLEGLDYKDGYLWLVGSHSLKRKKADKESVKKNFQQLTKLGKDGNRYLLARIPLVEREGSYTLEREAQQEGKTLTAAQLPCTEEASELTKALAQDAHLQAFLPIPGKDNGFDIEGLAVGDNGRIFLGLRGPVLRGWAVILELHVETGEENPGELKLKSINPNNPHNPVHPTYRKHFLDLGGLGIRDLCRDGADLLILAGPTMEQDGPVSLFRWKGGLEVTEESLIRAEALAKVLDIPFGQREDHAEGISLFFPDGNETRSLIVVYDAASESRQLGSSALEGDIFALPA